MADFPHYQSQSQDQGADLVRSIVNQRLAMAEMIRRKQEADENMNFQIMSGVAKSELPVYVPELVEEMRAARGGSPQELNDKILRASQIAQARKALHGDVIQRAASIRDTLAAGGDPNAAMVEHQNMITSGQLPPDLVAQSQRELGTQVQAGTADRFKVQEQRGFDLAKRDEERAFDERTYQNRFAQEAGERRAFAAEQIKVQDERMDLDARRDYALKYNVAWDGKMSWPEVHAAAQHQIDNAGTIQPNEVRAANRQLVLEVAKSNKNTPKRGEINDAAVMGRAKELNTLAAKGGSDLVVMPVITNEAGITNWSEDVELQAMTWPMARLELAKMYAVAQSEGEDSEAAKLVGHIVALASTSESTSLKAMLAKRVTDPTARETLQEIAVNAQKLGRSVAIRDKGGNVTGFRNEPYEEPAAAAPTRPRRQLGSVRGAPSGRSQTGQGLGVLAPSESGALRAAGYVAAKQDQQGARARASNKELAPKLARAFGDFDSWLGERQRQGRAREAERVKGAEQFYKNLSEREFLSEFNAWFSERQRLGLAAEAERARLRDEFYSRLFGRGR